MKNNVLVSKILLYVSIIITFSLVGYYALNGEYMGGTVYLGILSGILMIAGYALGKVKVDTENEDDDY